MRRAWVWAAAICTAIAPARGPCACADPGLSGPAAAAPASANHQERDVDSQARQFLAEYQQQLAQLELRSNLAAWQAANSGRKEDFDTAAAASLALRTYHSRADAYQRLKQLQATAVDLTPEEQRRWPWPSVPLRQPAACRSAGRGSAAIQRDRALVQHLPWPAERAATVEQRSVGAAA